MTDKRIAIEVDNLFFTKEDIASMPSEIYKRPCKPCPSMYGEDPESAEIMTWPKDVQIGLLFVCAWRRKKLCHGRCKASGFNEADVADFKDRFLNDR